MNLHDLNISKEIKDALEERDCFLLNDIDFSVEDDKVTFYFIGNDGDHSVGIFDYSYSPMFTSEKDLEEFINTNEELYLELFKIEDIWQEQELSLEMQSRMIELTKKLT